LLECHTDEHAAHGFYGAVTLVAVLLGVAEVGVAKPYLLPTALQTLKMPLLVPINKAR